MRPDSGPQESAGLESCAIMNTAETRPFVERRRRRGARSGWHEALEPVHRLLVRYERANEQLTEAEESYRCLVENAQVGIFRAAPDGAPLIVNGSMARICGYESPHEMLSEVSNLAERLFADPSQWAEVVHVLETRGCLSGIETETHTRDGARRWLELNMLAVCDGDRVAHFEGTATDITDRKRLEDRIRLLAYYDPVTRLPKRPLFEEWLVEALAAARWKSQRVALLVLEINRYKMINDSLGKVFGDRLLQEVAGRIQMTVGQQTNVARLSGAEFAIILEDVKAALEVERVAEQVLGAVSGEFSFLGSSLNVSCTMGISIFPLDGWDSQMLIERADVAMCSARGHGASSYQFFTEEMNSQIRERLKLENGLQLALERDELFLEYQPQIDVRTGGVVGLEALLRWQHPEMGVVPPAEFIGIAESTGLILPIGEWVLRTACSQARKWQKDGLRPVPVAVNVSALQFRQQGFCEMVRTVLGETGLDPKYLELELTEGLLLSNADVVFKLIRELREMGVKLAIDDFGTGYSSFGYLRQFKVNRLKIDRSFVREVSVNADDAAITTAIINMAKALNLDVMAEGVESEEQLDFLRAQQCYAIQGFYFSRPVASEHIAERLQGSAALDS
jgi:diguanylate cyclase (GGDEF)-like protein/PAS domain S-box-containing protein